MHTRFIVVLSTLSKVLYAMAADISPSYQILFTWLVSPLLSIISNIASSHNFETDVCADDKTAIVTRTLSIISELRLSLSGRLNAGL